MYKQQQQQQEMKGTNGQVKHTFRILGTVTAKGLKLFSKLALLFLETTRGLMLLKIVMMKMLMGNMRRPLSTPTMISCQVICNDPGKEGEKARLYIRGKLEAGRRRQDTDKIHKQ